MANILLDTAFQHLGRNAELRLKGFSHSRAMELGCCLLVAFCCCNDDRPRTFLNVENFVIQPPKEPEKDAPTPLTEAEQFILCGVDPDSVEAGPAGVERELELP